MIYKVTARLKSETARELHRKLNDGTIERQQPDGREIVASMRRAVVSDAGQVCWSELCYCDTPLEHERETVYDHHFDELQTEVVEAHQQQQGRPFFDFLSELASQ